MPHKIFKYLQFSVFIKTIYDQGKYNKIHKVTVHPISFAITLKLQEYQILQILIQNDNNVNKKREAIMPK